MPDYFCPKTDLKQDRYHQMPVPGQDKASQFPEETV
jgi:hypothetical protein